MWRSLLLLASALFAACPVEAESSARSLVIHNANVVNVRSGRVLSGQTVVVTGSRISFIGAPQKAEDAGAAQVIDAGGAYLIPGLIDTHAHLWWEDPREHRLLSHGDLERYLDNGVTSIRQAGRTYGDAAGVEARERARRGEIRSPRISISGMVNSRAVAKYGSADARSLAEHLVRLGVDGLKVRDGLTIQDVQEVIAVGKAAGLPVYGHTSDIVGSRSVEYSAAAVVSGLAGVMHLPVVAGAALPERPSDPDDWQAAWLWDRLGWLSFPERDRKTLIRTMVERGAWLEPTLAVEHFIAFPQQYEALAAERGTLDLIEGAREGFPRFTGEDLAIYRKAYQNMAAFVREFAGAGGMVLAGTDCPRCALVQDELALLVEAGLTPLQALQAGTINAAKALGYRDIGRVEVGATADLLLVGGNPLENIRHTRSIITVIQGGKVVKRRSLAVRFSTHSSTRARPR